jgi:hypothetical protein
MDPLQKLAHDVRHAIQTGDEPVTLAGSNVELATKLHPCGDPTQPPREGAQLLRIMVIQQKQIMKITGILEKMSSDLNDLKRPKPLVDRCPCACTSEMTDSFAPDPKYPNNVTVCKMCGHNIVMHASTAILGCVELVYNAEEPQKRPKIYVVPDSSSSEEEEEEEEENEENQFDRTDDDSEDEEGVNDHLAGGKTAQE